MECVFVRTVVIVHNRALVKFSMETAQQIYHSTEIKYICASLPYNATLLNDKLNIDKY